VAIFVSSMAALEKLKLMNPSQLPPCSVALGLSLGEYSALCFANSITFEEGVKLTSIRGKAMQYASDLTPSGMVSVVGLPQNVIEELCHQTIQSLPPLSLPPPSPTSSERTLQIGTYLTEKNFSVSGGREALEIFVKLAQDRQPQKMVMLPVAGAFHSSYMSSALPSLQEALSQTPVQLPEVPVVANTLGRPYGSAEEIRRELLRQVVEPVQWKSSMDLLLSSPGNDFEIAYEIGPGKVCAGILKTISRRAKVANIAA
jgi:[acyl-carrier-protein] S-malonyltransferase